MTVPYVPTPFATPILPPSVGVFGRPLPYLSTSAYQAAPTAMDLSNLLSDSDDTLDNPASPAAQLQALADVLRRASAWADRYTMGADAAAKGASLCLTQSVENAYVPVVQGELRLICAFKPIVEVDGIDIGLDPSSVQSIGSNVAKMVRTGVKVLYVPFYGVSQTIGGLPDTTPGAWRSGKIYAVWSYWNGYPHLQLTGGPYQVGSTSISVTTNGPNNVVKGVWPGSQLTIYDMADLSSPGVETVTVSTVSGTTLNLASPTLYEHSVPEAPDWIPVTAIPDDVGQAVIFLATALIKSRGDDAIVLEGVTEASQIKGAAADIVNDVATAFEMLDDFRVMTKFKA